MSSLRNAIGRRAHKERAQLHSRKKFGLFEKHKDHVLRAQAFHKKDDSLRKLKEKAAFRNPDEFYFKMTKTKTVDGIHKLENQSNKYTQEELMLMKTQDIGYVLQKVQSEKGKVERLSAMLHSISNHLPNKQVYYAEDRKEAKEIQSRSSQGRKLHATEDAFDHLTRKTAASYRELGSRKERVNNLEKLYMDMALQKQLQKKGRKRKLHEDEIVCPTSRPVYKCRWNESHDKGVVNLGLVLLCWTRNKFRNYEGSQAIGHGQRLSVPRFN